MWLLSTHSWRDIKHAAAEHLLLVDVESASLHITSALLFFNLILALHFVKMHVWSHVLIIAFIDASLLIYPFNPEA